MPSRKLRHRAPVQVKAGVITAGVKRERYDDTRDDQVVCRRRLGLGTAPGCIVDGEGSIAGEQSFTHSGAGLAELCDWLLSIAGEASVVAVAIEVPHGPVVDSLIDRGFVVHAINPRQLDRLRDRLSVAGAKDDRRDAYVLGDGIR